MAAAKKTTKRKINTLHDYPRQAQLFPDMTDLELADLAADMDQNGLREPVQILRDGTIISGHQRVLAAKQLGWTEIEVVICDDLEAQGAAVVERRFIEANLNRRQLDPLSVVRCFKALDMLYKSDADPTEWQDQPDLLDDICRRLEMSPKNAGRYLKLTEAPIAVQQAFSRGKLPLVLAARVAGLPSEQQQEIAARITAGEEPRKLVESFRQQARRRQPSATDSYLAFSKGLTQLLTKKPKPVEEISQYVANESAIEKFEETVTICRQLIRWTKTALKCR